MDGQVTCECCGYPTEDFLGFYCQDTPTLKPGRSFQEHQEKRIWLCSFCFPAVLGAILQTRPWQDWQSLVACAGAELRFREGTEEEEEDR
jgi:hypothetical protein